MDYTIPHEELHLVMGPDFKANTNGKMMEATTDFFTRRIAEENKGKHYTAYIADGRVKVMEEMAILLGDGETPDDTLIRKAYFGRNEEDIYPLSNAVDEKLRPGAFRKIVQLMDEGKFLKARALIQKKNINIEPPKFTRPGMK